MVSVRDSGVGAAPDNLEQLFNAFYTTKPDGMGVGLSISRVDHRGPRRSPLGARKRRGGTDRFVLDPDRHVVRDQQRGKRQAPLNER